MDELKPLVLLITSGLLLRYSLIFTGQAWAKSHAQTVTFMVLPIITYIITKTISGNIALSLGMIGALSIVRFRHPVKSALELVMYFALITLGIESGVSIKLAFLLLVIVLATILGIEILQFLMKYFNFQLYQHSFNEGIAKNVLEISTSKKNSKIQESSNLVESFYSKSDNQFMYKLIFNSKDDLDNFLQNIDEDENTITYKTSSIVN